MQKSIDTSLVSGAHTSGLAACSMWDDIIPYGWQADIISDLFVPGSRVIVSTPNEAGKTSWLVSNAGLACMTMFPGCEVVSTAGVFRQVSQQLWPVVRAKASAHPAWQVTDDLLRAPSVNGLPPARWSIFSASDPEKAEGYHSRKYKDNNGNMVYAPLLYIIDEAKSVVNGIFEAMYRCDPDFVLIVSTPGEESGSFFEIIDQYNRNKEAGIPQIDTGIDWKYHNISWNDCPHLLTGKSKRTRQQLIKLYGIKNPFIQSMVFGNFYRSGGFYVFNSRNVIECMRGSVIGIPAEKFAAVDLAGGGDEVVFGIRRGNICRKSDMETRTDKDTAKTSRWLESLFMRHQLRPEQIVIDEGGMGQPIVDELEARGWIGIQRYNFDGKPSIVERYQSVGMEDAHNLSMLIDQHDIIIPDDESLRNQMRKRKYTMVNNNQSVMALESKRELRKRGESSPDRLDMLLMLFKDISPSASVNSISSAVPSYFSKRIMNYQQPEHGEGVYGMRMEE